MIGYLSYLAAAFAIGAVAYDALCAWRERRYEREQARRRVAAGPYR